MEELRIIIAPNGEYMKFGKWVFRSERKDEDSHVWHSDSFLKEVYPTPWFQQLNIPYNFSLTVKLSKARYILSLLNF